MKSDNLEKLTAFVSMLHHLGATKSDQMAAAMMVSKEEDRFRLTKWTLDTVPTIDEALEMCLRIYYKT